MTDGFKIESRKQRNNLDEFAILEKRQNDLF
jgi:hypothetical protein